MIAPRSYSTLNNGTLAFRKTCTFRLNKYKMTCISKHNYVSKYILNVMRLYLNNTNQCKAQCKACFSCRRNIKTCGYIIMKEEIVIVPGSQNMPVVHQLLQVTPGVLCECYKKTSLLHTSQHCTTWLSLCFDCLQPLPYQTCMQMRDFCTSSSSIALNAYYIWPATKTSFALHFALRFALICIVADKPLLHLKCTWIHSSVSKYTSSYICLYEMYRFYGTQGCHCSKCYNFEVQSHTVKPKRAFCAEINADSNGILHDMISEAKPEIQGEWYPPSPQYLWYMGYNLGRV